MFAAHQGYHLLSSQKNFGMTSENKILGTKSVSSIVHWIYTLQTLKCGLHVTIAKQSHVTGYPSPYKTILEP